MAQTTIPNVSERARIWRIILIALAIGQVMIASVLFFVRHQDAAGGPSMDPKIPWILMGLAGFLLLQRFAVPGMVGRIGAKAAASISDPERRKAHLLQTFQTMTILRGAFAEAGGLLCALAYFFSGEPIALVLIVIMVAATLLPIPSESTFEEYAGSVGI